VNPKNESPRPFAVLRMVIDPSIKRLSSPKSGSASRKTNGLLSWDWKQENYHDSLANAANSVRERAGTCSARTRIRFYRIRRGKGIPPRRRRVGNHSSIRQQTRSPPARSDRYEESTVSPSVARAREALALPFIDLTTRDSLVDKELAPRAIPERIYARKPCARA
jgi:hypothetical protein